MKTAESPSKGAVGGKQLKIYVNGRLLPQHEATISVFDSGLNFADGVFEGVRIYNGTVFRLEQHVKRLFESAKAFEIDIRMSQDEFTRLILEWLRENEIQNDFHLRPIVTRGNRFPPRLDPRFCSDEPNVILLGGPISPASMRGQTLTVSSVRQINSDAIDPKIKSLNYGNNLLARLDAVRRGVDDAIMLDGEGFVAEASAANLFIVKDGDVITPWTKACLDGITRRVVMEIAGAQGRRAVERDISVTEVLNADEVFLCGTGTELTPVVQVEGRKIGSGAAGAITQALYSAFIEMARSEGTPINAVAGKSS